MKRPSSAPHSRPNVPRLQVKRDVDDSDKPLVAQISARSAATPKRSATPTSNRDLRGDAIAAQAERLAQVITQAKSRQTEKAKKLEWLEQSSRFKQKLLLLQKEIFSTLTNVSGEYIRNVTPLEEAEKKLQLEWEAEAKEMVQQLKKVRQSVGKLRSGITNIKGGGGQEYIEAMRGLMDAVENDVAQFKAKQTQRLEVLLQDDRSLTRDLSLFEKRLEAWTPHDPTPEYYRNLIPIGSGGGESSASTENGSQSKPGDRGRAGSPTKNPRGARSRSQDEGGDDGSASPKGGGGGGVPKEVLAVQNFLKETGGMSGGWDERDHATFLKLRTQYGHSKEVFFEKALAELPTHDEETLRAHDQWYDRYLSLVELKKQAIQAWKERKEKERREALSRNMGVREDQEDSGGDEGEVSPGRRRQLDAEEERKRKEEVQRQLQEWKDKKDAEVRQKEEEERRAEEARRRKEMAERARRQQIKEQVRQYQEVKERQKQADLEEQRAKLREQEEAKKMFSSEDLQRLRERDELLVLQRQAKAREREKEKEEKERRLEKLRSQVQVNAERDFSRLTKDTQARAKRNEEKEFEEKEKPPIYAFPVTPGRRAIPVWRNGV